MTNRIEPEFELPPVEGWEYTESDSVLEEDSVDVEDDEVLDATEEFILSDTDDADALFPPDTMTVIEKRVRLDAVGNTVVDIVVDVDGTPGALQYDVRLTKR